MYILILFLLKTKKMKRLACAFLCLILLADLAVTLQQMRSTKSKSKSEVVSLDKVIQTCIPYLKKSKSAIWRFFFETKPIKELCSSMLYEDNNSFLFDKHGINILINTMNENGLL